MDILIKRPKIFSRRDDIIQVWRLPPTKTLRAHLFGSTLGLIGAFFIIVLDHPTLFGGLAWYAALVAIGIFILGTYLGGAFVILTAILFFLKAILPTGPLIFSSLTTIAVWYFIFYAIGAVFTTLYDALVFLDLISFGKKQIKIAFAYDTTKKINVIKSPYGSEEQALGQLVARRPELKEQKLYRFELKAPPQHPYTIAFVANPKIRRRQTNGTVSYQYDPDPIMNDLDLFLRTVNNALYSFELDQVLGHREIYSRVRVITVFDNANSANLPDDALSLLQNFQEDVPSNGSVAESLIYPRTKMINYVVTMLPAGLTIGEIDVIYALSASQTQIRHTAYYADFDENGVGPLQPSSQGTPFDYDANPNMVKGTDITNVAPCVDTPTPHTPNPPFDCKHDDYAAQPDPNDLPALPGRVALNVLSAGRHTFIHEFAHAMSSAVRGAICDEYYDKSFLRTSSGVIFTPFYVNRIERVKKTGGNFVPVHLVFAKYNDEVFLSDLAHPSVEEEWLSYFPERHCPSDHCTMDRTAEPFRFDKLLSRFMYDRLISKLNRPNP